MSFVERFTIQTTDGPLLEIPLYIVVQCTYIRMTMWVK